MKKRATLVLAGLTAGAIAVGGAVAAGAAGPATEHDTAITGPALDRASAAALAHTGGGTVTGTEVGDEESRYEVEVRLPDGRSMDVQLDESFQFVGDKVDADPAPDAGA